MRQLCFESSVQLLRQCGIHLERLPGEYRINYQNGSPSTARFAETLQYALIEGFRLAGQTPQSPHPPPRKHNRPLTLKAKRRCKILFHNHRIWARRMKRTKPRSQEKMRSDAFDRDPSNSE